MRYTDEQLWDMGTEELNTIKTSLTFNRFCIWSIGRLQQLIKDSLDGEWMNPEIKHLRNYRIKAVSFYEKKLVR